MEKRCASLFCRAARRVNIPNFLDFIFYSTLLSLHNIIDGREKLRPPSGYLSVRRSLDVHGESETPSTFCTPTSSSFVSPCGLGEGERKFTESLL